MTPNPRSVPLVPLLLGSLVAIALIGAAIGAFGDHPAAKASPTPTPSLLIAGGSAWPAPSTASPVVTPTLTPTLSPTPSLSTTPVASAPTDARFTIRVCSDQRAGRCVRELERVRGAFVVILSFSDSNRGDVVAIHLEGPNGRRLDGATLTLGGGRGAAWSNFHGGLADGRWDAVASLNGSEVARTTFVAR
jgi:hypothetical protein